jgi:ABC-type Mn2+/Zn2+ transport system ATPase subunit
MPSFNIIKEISLNQTFRTKSIIGSFDLQIDEKIREQFVGNIAIEEEDWRIGIIVGASGSGKTTIAKELFKDYYINDFKYDSNSIIDNMPKDKTVQEITNIFNSVGFATVWSWLKPYSVLSNGERMRVDLAQALLSNNDIIVFDEFTSVVDRTIAKVASYAISRSIRKSNKKFIAVA